MHEEVPFTPTTAKNVDVFTVHAFECKGDAFHQKVSKECLKAEDLHTVTHNQAKTSEQLSKQYK
jgi:hypothetical protein